MVDERIEQMGPEEIEQEEHFKEAFNDEGNWKSLGHRFDYSGELKDLPAEGPDPFKYQPDEIEKFNSDLFFYRQRENVKQAIKETLPQTPAQPPVESPEERVARLRRDIALLGESSLDGAPGWENPHVQRDLEELVNTFNNENEEGLIVLPKEEVEWGATKRIKPSDMVFFKLPKDVHAEILRTSQNNFKDRNRSQSTWAALRKTGYASEAQPTFIKHHQSGPKESGEKPTNKEDPWGSQRAFTEWRMKNGARR